MADDFVSNLESINGVLNSKLSKRNEADLEKLATVLDVVSTRLSEADKRVAQIKELIMHGNLSDFINMESIDGVTLLSVLSAVDETSRGDAERILKQKESEINSENAKKTRKPNPTKEQLLEFRSNWFEKYSREDGAKTDRGWKTAAGLEFNIDIGTVSSRIK